MPHDLSHAFQPLMISVTSSGPHAFLSPTIAQPRPLLFAAVRIGSNHEKGRYRAVAKAVSRSAVLETWACHRCQGKHPPGGKVPRGSEIVIVTHEGGGWVDPLSDGKGDVFSLVTRRRRRVYRRT